MPSPAEPSCLVPESILALARKIDPAAAARTQCPGAPCNALQALKALAQSAFPAAASATESQGFAQLLDSAFGQPKTRADFLALLRSDWPLQDPTEARRSLRIFARVQRLRIALRELLPLEAGGASFETTARELSDLAEAVVEIALQSARSEVETRLARPLLSDGSPSKFVVLGMGKLAGQELNAGSDIDLIFVYDSDDGEAQTLGSQDTVSLHEYWSRVARRLTSALEEMTEEGTVWRVDLRLRPEGRSGPVVNSVAAMLRYYETWGRLWERAALMRARPIAGDLDLGAALLQELEPFVFRRTVDPSLATELLKLVERSRNESSADPSRDLKLGLGGIRELEMFVQVLQLIWGGVEQSVRAQNTLEGLRRLWAQGLATSREAEDLADSWHLLRRAEHVVQNSTGLQTHLLPSQEPERGRLARCLGFEQFEQFEQALARSRSRVHACLQSLTAQQVAASRWEPLLLALDAASEAQVVQELGPAFGSFASRELARDLIALCRRPDALLGTLTRDRHPAVADVVLDSLADAADPEQAARYLRSYFARSRSPSIHVALLAPNARALRRFITVLGASAFVGDLVERTPELGDQVPFAQDMPSLQRARTEVEREVEAARQEAGDDVEALVGALRRAKVRLTLEVALADLSAEAELAQVQPVLTEVADACLEGALTLALGRESADGFCVVAVGKYGGRELGYGSDLDVFFVFDPARVPEGLDALDRYVRVAQRTMRLLAVPHVEGPGYELDTRLRPSGSQGVLVSSLPAFSRYHGLSPQKTGAAAAPWERQTLIRARVCAGDRTLGAQVLEIAHRAAFELGPPDPAETHRLRTRLETEIGRERGGRHDLKVGRGGLLDIEFAVQVLQMRHGTDLALRVASTLEAIERLEQAGWLASQEATTLREGYLFLRRLEQRMHIVHATSRSLLEAQAPGLVPLARRMGFHNEPSRSAQQQLMERYRAITEGVREAYLKVLGVSDSGSGSGSTGERH